MFVSLFFTSCSLSLCMCVSRYYTFKELDQQIKFVSRNFPTKLTLCDHRNGNKAINKKAATARQLIFSQNIWISIRTRWNRLPHKNPIIWFIESIPKFTNSFKSLSFFSLSLTCERNERVGERIGFCVGILKRFICFFIVFFLLLLTNGK